MAFHPCVSMAVWKNVPCNFSSLRLDNLFMVADAAIPRKQTRFPGLKGINLCMVLRII